MPSHFKTKANLFCNLPKDIRSKLVKRQEWAEWFDIGSQLVHNESLTRRQFIEKVLEVTKNA